jgi:hypothetical protein
MSRSWGARHTSGGDSYALENHSDNRDSAAPAKVNPTNPTYPRRHDSKREHTWAGSEEHIVEAMDDERHSERSTDRIVRKTEVTIAYDNMRAQQGNSFR